MPYRNSREDVIWLMPPSLDDWLPVDHAARFVRDLVDALMADREWMAGRRDEGAPAYHPSVLVSVWLYGFMTGTRSTRKLEAACREQVPLLWLTGNQRPDHNTLWRFYEQHTPQLRTLFKQSVRMALGTGYVDLALQAIDGTKVAGNAAKDQTYDERGLRRLLERIEAAIEDLEAQNRTGGEPVGARLPDELVDATARRERITAALAELEASGRERLNLTDPDAQLMKTRQGFVAGYNAQVAVSPVTVPGSDARGLLITAVDLVQDPEDHGQLLPMLEQAAEVTGHQADLTLADAGYHSGANLAGCEARGQIVLMPEAHSAGVLDDPYHKDRFAYAETSDTFQCPRGEVLHFSHTKHHHGRPGARVYRPAAGVCRTCPAFGICTRDRRQGRSLEIGPYDAPVRRHRLRMATPAAKEAYVQRQVLDEPVFGILKEVMHVRRLLRRGLTKGRDEMRLVATAFNLRTIYRLWRGAGGAGGGYLVARG
jgi:transposase